MKTKIYKSYPRAARIGTTECIYIGSTDQQAFAHRADLKDFGDTTIAERSFSWLPNDKRTLRVFRLRNGDVGYRAFGSGLGDDKLAHRIFDNEVEALALLELNANSYINSNKGWKEV